MLRQQATAASAQSRLACNCWDMWDAASHSTAAQVAGYFRRWAWQAVQSDAVGLPESSTSSMVAQLNSCCRVSSASFCIAAMHASSTAASTCTARRAPLHHG